MQNRLSPVFTVRIMPASPAAAAAAAGDSSSEDSFRLDAHEEDVSEHLDTLMDELKNQMATIHEASVHVRKQMKGLMKRAKKESIQWMEEPLQLKTSSARTWARKHGLPPQPTLNAFLDACFTTAESLDLETRMLTFSRSDAAALWAGQQRLSIFDILVRLPALFE